MPHTSHRITVQQAIEEIRQGRMVIVVDDEQRENEGDFVVAAVHMTPEKVNFLLKYARGMICVPMTRQRIGQLDLWPMVAENQAPLGTSYTVTVDSAQCTTGISAYDRYLTINALVNERTRPHELVRPGHINPLIAREGGVLVRAGHTEASLDLCRLADLPPVGVICEILNEDGTMARMPDLEQVAEQHGLGILTIEDLIRYRKEHERLVRRVVTANIPNGLGTWKVTLYENTLNGEEHTALVFGEPEKQEAPLVRVHSKCFTGDTLMSTRCDCGPQLLAAMEKIAREGHGVILYMNQEGRGIGLRAKLMAYNLQEQGQDTVQANVSLGFPPDLREYGIGAQILEDLGLKKIRLMTNNPAKIVGISGFGLEVADRVPLEAGRHRDNERYLRTKAERMGHLLTDLGLPETDHQAEHVSPSPAKKQKPGYDPHGVPTGEWNP